MPLGQVRAAVAEFCRTGARPTYIEWQPGQYY
ncbi:Imm1 family immunity protein [Saccharopolyspora sp. K220]|nr:Imm1 family immunity protein [Saccharopolyspora soli]MCI2417612.1 Imm1 family immunity protein [Saccharopolyspora soli]